MDNIERKCPMDCSKCTFRQNVYCSAQIGLTVHEMLRVVTQRLNAIESKLNLLQADTLFIEPMAQQGAVAHKVDSPNNQSEE